MTPEAQITNLEAIKKFITAGNAIFTLVSKKTGARKTFRVVAAEPKPGFDPGFFVSLLINPDVYKYLGFLHTIPNGELRIKQNKNRWGEDAYQVFCWLLCMINNGHTLDMVSEFWHAGRCGRCGRVLTVPSSIASGIGPVCAGMGS